MYEIIIYGCVSIILYWWSAMNDPITPIYGTLILIMFPIATAYVVDYLYTLWDFAFPKKIKYRE